MDRFVIPDTHEHAYGWQTFLFPVLFDPIRAVMVTFAVWIVGLLAVMPFVEPGTELVPSLVIGVPFIAALWGMHFVDHVRNPVARVLARSKDGRELLDRGTGAWRSREAFVLHERTWAAHYAAEGDTRDLQVKRLEMILSLERTVSERQRLFLATS